MLFYYLLPVYKCKQKFTKVVVYLGSLYFCIYYLLEVYEKRYTTFFELTTAKSTYPKLSICIPLEIFSKNDTVDFCKFNLSIAEDDAYKDKHELKDGCLKYFELTNFYFNESVAKTPSDVIKKADELRLNSSFLIMDNFEFDAYYLNSNNLCLKYNFNVNLTKFSILNVYRYELIGIYSILNF